TDPDADKGEFLAEGGGVR
nr:RecName: Full=Fibrinogen alpha chain; Contains: RecName: Full=Fibrinopeptide A [Lama glama]P68219.1 RecName: Full=Fibrinogen alpha chain; Contains: RecName: Full=Fibrinopeptide A [Vicugna vicugna]prf//650771K fibrinopeptide A [Lama glama]prf//670960D fibrinopeptide A [Vicugna vicugna]